VKIHWFSVTVFAPYEHALDMWQAFFQLELGDLVSTPNRLTLEIEFDEPRSQADNKLLFGENAIHGVLKNGHEIGFLIVEDKDLD